MMDAKEYDSHFRLGNWAYSQNNRECSVERRASIHEESQSWGSTRNSANQNYHRQYEVLSLAFPVALESAPPADGLLWTGAWFPSFLRTRAESKAKHELSFQLKSPNPPLPVPNVPHLRPRSPSMADSASKLCLSTQDKDAPQQTKDDLLIPESIFSPPCSPFR